MALRFAASHSSASYNQPMAPEPRYTDDHAKAGLDFPFPAIETCEKGELDWIEKAIEELRKLPEK